MKPLATTLFISAFIVVIVALCLPNPAELNQSPEPIQDKAVGDEDRKSVV